MFVTFSSLYSFNEVKPPNFHIPHLDKAVHFTFYFVACVLGVLFLRERSKSTMKLQRALILMLISTILFGAIIEVIQYVYTVNRMGDFVDGMANSLGSFCGAFAMKIYFSAKRGLKWKY